MVGPGKQDFWQKTPNIIRGNHCISGIQKLGMILEKQIVSKMEVIKKYVLNYYFRLERIRMIWMIPNIINSF